mmetsp:Transcript_113835/g.302546  ORF Transcript_113835/g.302546 Transcript_113835/m.302546 type:complete len:100 (+) Transcript_113835:67-366(+)
MHLGELYAAPATATPASLHNLRGRACTTLPAHRACAPALHLSKRMGLAEAPCTARKDVYSVALYLLLAFVTAKVPMSAALAAQAATTLTAKTAPPEHTA